MQCPFSVGVLVFGDVYYYTILSFCAIKMNLEHILLDLPGYNFDGFIRVEGNMSPTCEIPGSVDRHRGQEHVLVGNCCIVPVSFVLGV